MPIYKILQAPDNQTALLTNESSISYGELRQKIASFAKYLHEIGIKKGDRVALMCQNSQEFLYSYFAITSLGAITVPLNLMLTIEEIKYILQDSESKTLVIHEKILQKIQQVSELALNLVILTEAFYSQLPVSEINLEVDAQEDEVCTILYTSGTTGRPKGAMLTHRNLISDAESTGSVIKANQDDNFLCVLPMFHSFAFTVCVMVPLYYGGQITIQEAFNPKETISLMHNKKVTVFSGVPVMFNFISQVADKQSLEYVRLAISGGAPLPLEVLEAFENKFNLPVSEGYGLSEASPVVSLNPLDRERKKGSIGTALPNIDVKIVDDNEVELATGEVGELLTRGPNVMKGYLNLPEATAEALKDGWLHTGDIAYIDEDGYIFIVDRKKDMMIVGGLNVYPREIEEHIYNFSGVSECAVIGIPDISRGEIIKAYIVAKEGYKVEKNELIKYLRLHLATYKLPKIVEMISAIPKTGPGKVDKKLLRKMTLEG
jgi:long-chain acyl-CoA synthetase